MLPRGSRLHRAEDFRRVVRQGRRAGCSTLVVHATLQGAASELAPSAGVPRESQGRAPVRAGFVVSRAVGPAVVRNRVKRRLRAAIADPALALPAGADLVIRALPASAASTSAQLRRDLARCLERVMS